LHIIGIYLPLHGIFNYNTKMKKVFALLTIVSVMSFVACKPKANDDEKRRLDSIRTADSQRSADSLKAAEAEAAAAALAADTANRPADTANMPK
jgi:hypothetical protein